MRKLIMFKPSEILKDLHIEDLELRFASAQDALVRNVSVGYYGFKYDLFIEDESVPYIAEVKPKNTPHGPQRNARKGKPKKW